MQEINLLQNKVKDTTASFEKRNRFMITIFTLVIILELLAGVGLFLLTKTTQNQVTVTQGKSQAVQEDLDANQGDLALATGLQAQLKNLRALLTNHIHWSVFYDTLSSLTTNKVQYSNITAGSTDGRVTLEGVAPSYTDVGKLILSLSTSDKFSDVRLNTLGPSSGKTFGYNFSIDLTASSKLFVGGQ